MRHGRTARDHDAAEAADAASLESDPDRADRFAAGVLPAPVADSDDAAIAELKAKVKALVDRDHGGDFHRAFDAYAASDQLVKKSELVELLADADVGNFATRGIWAGKIIAKLDTNGDRAISWAEFSAVLGG